MPDVNIVVKAKDEASKTLQGIGGSLQGLGSIALGVGAVGGVAVLGIGAAAAKLAIDAAKLEPTRITFDNLTRSIGSTADSMLKKLRPATMGVLKDSDLMLAGNKLMAMGLAKSEQEAADLAKMAVTLGTAMGTDATSSLENFTLMLANQSIPRLDTFGISSGQVRNRIEELMEATEGLTREQAFMQAVMEIGGESMEKVGDVSDTMAIRMQAVQATMGNLKDQLGTALMPLLEIFMGRVLTPIVDKISEWAPLITPIIEQFGYLAQAILDPDQDWVAYLNNEVYEALENAFGEDAATKIVEFVQNFLDEAGEFVDYAKEELLPTLEDFWKDIQEDVIPALSDFALAMGEWAASDGVQLFFQTLKALVDLLSDIAKAVDAAQNALQRWKSEHTTPEAEKEAWLQSMYVPYMTQGGRGVGVTPEQIERLQSFTPATTNINVYGLPGLEEEVRNVVTRTERQTGPGL